LNTIEYYQITPPKSLGIEWLNQYFSPLIDKTNDTLQNKLFTLNEHIALQICEIIKKFSIQKLLITGGGAYNTFLIDRIKSHTDSKIIIPNSSIIEFKEAIIFGLLGALYLSKEINVLNSVTGASRNSCSGVLHLPN
jgi:anhydro-N-acetylmuramic acid kinase